MNQNNWYTGTNWDKETRDLFETKLKKSRGSHNKSQYLLIKGGCLLRSNDSYKESVGIELIERLFKDFPDEIPNVMFGYEQLGDYYFSKGDYEKAENNYRQSVSFYKEIGRSGSSGVGDIKLAEIIVKTNQHGKFNEMYDLLTDKFKKTGGSLSLNEDIFRYYSALAKLCDGLRRNDLAKEYAKKALEVSKVKEPQLDKYPQLGIIKTDEAELNNLKEILIR